MKTEFLKYKETLFGILLVDHYCDAFLAWIGEQHAKGKSNAQLHALFLDFHADIQKDPRTKDSEMLYDRLSDFMDGFTVWGKGFRILPEERDVQ